MNTKDDNNIKKAEKLAEKAIGSTASVSLQSLTGQIPLLMKELRKFSKSSSVYSIILIFLTIIMIIAVAVQIHLLIK